MNKIEFIEKLTKKLHENHISNAEEIATEYEAHFAFKLADGYTEEEVAAKLGDPIFLAEQYAVSEVSDKSTGKRAVTVTGLVFVNFFTGAFFTLLGGWVAVMGVFTVLSAAVGVCLFGGLNIYSLIPSMPYSCGLIFSVSFIALSALSFVGTVYCAMLAKQLIKAYGRFHRNCIASSSGKAALPSLATFPQMSPKAGRRMRKMAIISLLIFAVAFIIAYVSCIFTAEAIEFWHKWHWFVS